MKGILAFSLCAIGFIVLSCATPTTRTSSATHSILLPQDIQITPPDPSLPEDIRAFSGKWEGTWYSGDTTSTLEGALAVQKIDEKKAEVLFCWGDSSSVYFGQRKKGCQSYVADLENKRDKFVVRFKSSSGRTYEFYFEEGNLEGWIVDSDTLFTTSRVLTVPRGFLSLKNVRIIPPNDNLPEEIKALSGKWAGTWYSREGHYKAHDGILIVERIERNKADIIYHTNLGRHVRLTIDLFYQQRELSFSIPSTMPSRGYQFRFDGNNLHGEWVVQSLAGPFYTYEVEMRRIP